MYDIQASNTERRPPDWAMLQRDLFETMADAVDRFVDDYFDEDGEPYWPPDDHVGVDGFDDVIEGFYNWPLVYAMGGDDRFLERAQDAYEGALQRGTDTDTPFGHPMVVDEFEQCRDWFHMGEGNLFTYNMGLAAPGNDLVVDRAERFAHLYFDDANVNNYDGENRLVRGPMSGSMGRTSVTFRRTNTTPTARTTAGRATGSHGGTSSSTRRRICSTPETRSDCSRSSTNGVQRGTSR